MGPHYNGQRCVGKHSRGEADSGQDNRQPDYDELLRMYGEAMMRIGGLEAKVAENVPETARLDRILRISEIVEEYGNYPIAA